MAPNSSTLAWKIPWAEEPGKLRSMGSLRVGHDWATSLSLFTFMHWRRKWQPTPVFLPGESQGRGSLMGFRLWGHTVRHDWSDLAAVATGLTLKHHLFLALKADFQTGAPPSALVLWPQTLGPVSFQNRSESNFLFKTSLLSLSLTLTNIDIINWNTLLSPSTIINLFHLMYIKLLGQHVKSNANI